MNFLRKYLFYIITIGIFATLFLFPELKLKLRDLFFPIAEIENAVTIPESDFDIDLKGVNVASTNLKNLKKDKLIFLNFWGTWCPPCREEWPTIQKLYESEQNKVEFVLIAMQDQEDDVIQFLKKNNYTAPVYIAQSPISDRILPKVFPTTFLLNNTGRILLKEDAAKDWNAKSVHEFINQVKPK